MIPRYGRYYRHLIFLAVIISILENLFSDKLNHHQLTDFRSPVSRTDQKYNELQNNTESSQDSLFTSAWCRGQDHVHRLCRFRNLCFNPRIKKFLFFHHSSSVIIGMPKQRFDPAVTDFSSVADHNTQYFNYVDLPATAIADFNVTLLEGHALVFKRFNPENLMHVFHDDLLPVYSTLLEVFDSFEKQNVYLAFADERSPGPYYHLYSNFLESEPIFLANENPDKLVCFRNCYVGLNKYTTWYQYGFNKPQGKIEKDTTGISKIVQMFCQYFRRQFDIVPSNVEKKKVVLFDRRNNRRIVNKNEVVRFVEEVTQLWVQTYSLETHNLMEIISAISHCSILIAMHGALLVLSMFLSPGTVVVELFPYAIDSNVYVPYRTLATLSGTGIIYRAWENKIRNNSIPHPDNPPEFGGIRHLPPEEQEIIIRSTLVSPHLCCYNPRWLYHIYQDTIVDIPSFGKILRSALTVQQSFSVERYHSAIDETLRNNIRPDEVQNMSCTTLSNGDRSELVMSWRPPWNLNYIEYDVIEYEIWCQLSGSSDVRAFITKKTDFTFPKLSSDSSYHVWVRCNVDGLSGPFTSNPLVCLG